MDSIYDQTLKELHFVEQRANQLSYDLVTTLRDSLQNIVSQIFALQAKLLGDFQSESAQAKLDYLLQQKAEIERVTREIYASMNMPIQESALDVMEYVSKSTVKYFSPIVQFAISVPVLNTEVVQNWFKMSLVENLTINEWLAKLESNASDRIVKAGRQAMIENMTIQQTIKFMRKSGIEGSIPALEGLARTFCMSAANYAKEKAFKSVFGEVYSWQYIATLDGRTCPICGVDDLRIYKDDDPKRPRLPRHWRCRCTYIPRDKNQDKYDNQKLDADTRDKVIDFIESQNKYNKYQDRNTAKKKLIEYYEQNNIGHRPSAKHSDRKVRHRDGSTSTNYKVSSVDFVPENTSYNTWLKKMLTTDPEFVRKILGKTRFDLFKSGKITLDKMVTHGKIKKLSDLI